MVTFVTLGARGDYRHPAHVRRAARLPVVHGVQTARGAGARGTRAAAVHRGAGPHGKQHDSVHRKYRYVVIGDFRNL